MSDTSHSSDVVRYGLKVYSGSMNKNNEELQQKLTKITRAQARMFNGQHADRRYMKAIEQCERRTDAIARTIELLLTHPDIDPVERVDLMRSLQSIDRRSL